MHTNKTTHIRYAILEDEYYVAQEMEMMITRLRPDYELVGVKDDVVSSCQLLADEHVDLVVADFNLSDGYSPQVFERTGCRTPVIITTGYAQNRDRVGHLNVVDFLLKPVTAQVLEQSLEKFENNYNPITITKN